MEHDPNRAASDHDYKLRVREIDADTPGRFNADPARLFEASGSAGKVMTFAVRLDTFPKEAKPEHPTSGRTIRANSPKTAPHPIPFRRSTGRGRVICTASLSTLRRNTARTLSSRSELGTAWLPTLFAIKGRFDAMAGGLAFCRAI